MCFGGSKTTSVAAKTDEFYSAGKKDYGDLPSLAVGDKAKRTEDGMKDMQDPDRNKRKKANKERLARSLAKQTTNKDLARSLLMPYKK